MRKTTGRMTKAEKNAVLERLRRRFGRDTEFNDRRERVQQAFAKAGVATGRNRSYM
jgi:hypothetical protein